MANNKIEIYQRNTMDIGCAVTGVSDVSGYIPYLTVKSKSSDASTKLLKIGTVSDPSGTLLFSLTTLDSSIASGDYVYDVTIENGTTIYTIVRDRFTVLDGVRY